MSRLPLVGIDRTSRAPRLATLVVAVLAIAAASAPGALAGSTAAATPTASNQAHASKGRAVVKTYKLVPKVQRTVRSTGYSTYVFSAPPGKRILIASARIVSAQRHAVAIRSRAITAQLTRYTVNLVFPGEQGNPGKLVVRLVLAAG